MNHASQDRMRSQVDVSQVCRASVDSAISQNASTPYRLYGMRLSGNSLCVFPQHWHFNTLRWYLCMQSPYRTFRVQVPWTLSAPPQIGHRLLSLLKILVVSPLQDNSYCAILIMVCEREHWVVVIIGNVLVSSDWTHCFLLPHFLSCHNNSISNQKQEAKPKKYMQNTKFRLPYTKLFSIMKMIAT